jgi:hypothetical protein
MNWRRRRCDYVCGMKIFPVGGGARAFQQLH